MSDKLQINIQTNLIKPDIAEIKKLTNEIKKEIGTINVNSGKGIKIFDTNSKDMELYLQRMKNSLERLQIGKEKVFLNPEVKKQVEEFNAELAKLGTTGAKSTKELGVQFDTLRTHVAKTANEFKNVNKDGYGFITMLELAAKKIAIWGISTGIVYGSLRQLQEGIKTVYNVSNQMNEIRIVTGQTVEQTDALAKSYNKLAISMGTTTSQIADTAKELYRQGLSEEEVTLRLEEITKYAKISGITVQVANEIMTASINGTKASATELADVFSYLGDASASGKLPPYTVMYMTNVSLIGGSPLY